MRASSAKAKGRRLCLELQARLYALCPSLEAGDIEVTSSGAPGVDLKLSPAAKKAYPWAIECKNVEKLNIWDALKQCEANAKGDLPVLVFRRNNSKTYVTVELEEFLKVYDRARRVSIP